MARPRKKRENSNGNGADHVTHAQIEGPPETSDLELEVRRLEVAIIKEAYLVAGQKRHLADLWRLVEEHKRAVDLMGPPVN